MTACRSIRPPAAGAVANASLSTMIGSPALMTAAEAAELPAAQHTSAHAATRATRARLPRMVVQDIGIRRVGGVSGCCIVGGSSFKAATVDRDHRILCEPADITQTSR